MMRLSKYEKETILLTSEGDVTYDIYTFNEALKRKLAAFVEQYLQCCQLKESAELGSATYLIVKSRVSIRLIAPPSEERKNALRASAKKNGLVKM